MWKSMVRGLKKSRVTRKTGGRILATERPWVLIYLTLPEGLVTTLHLCEGLSACLQGSLSSVSVEKD